MIKKNSKKKFSDTEVAEKLKEVSFFKHYADNSEVILHIAELCNIRFFKKGSTIINEGEQGDELFIVLKGKIDILKTTLQNEKYVVTSLDAGRGSVYVGEIALIDHDRRSATVEAKTDCECIVLNRDAFIKFGDTYPEIGLNITRAIARQLSIQLRKSSGDVITLFSALVEEIASI